MATLILILAGFLLLALLVRAVMLIGRGVRDGWIGGTITGRDPGDGQRPEPRLQIGRVRLGFLSLFLIGVLAAAWSNGTFDKALHHVGLNAKECATNAFGATFCGGDLDRYQDQFDRLNGYTDDDGPTRAEIKDAKLQCRLGVGDGCDFLAEHGIAFP